MSLNKSPRPSMAAFYWCCYFLLLSTAATVNCKSTSPSLTDGPSNGSVDTISDSVANELRQMHQQLDTISDKLNNIQNTSDSLAISHSRTRMRVRSTSTVGWTYLPAAQKYYRVIFQLVDWDTADSRCRELGSKSHLVDVNDATENAAIRRFIGSINPRLSRICDGPKAVYSYYGGYWTSGQRANRTGNCHGGSNSLWMWKPYPGVTTPVSFSYWFPGEPNCHNKGEHCLHLMYSTTYQRNDFKWNDLNCTWPLCPLCELDI